MYKIFCENPGNNPICIFDDSAADKALSLQSGTVTINSKSSGNLTMTQHPGSLGYDLLEDYKSFVFVTRYNATSGNDDPIWVGRILESEFIFNLTKRFTCEGALSFFNDIIIDAMDDGEEGSGYTGTLSDFLTALFNEYNSRIGTNRPPITSVSISGVPDIAEFSYTVSYQSVYDILDDVLLSVYDGFPVLTMNGTSIITDGLTFEYKSFANPSDRVYSQQAITIGENMLDFSKTSDLDDFCTRLIPLGGEVDGKKLTIDDADIYWTEGLPPVSVYGYIDKVMEWPDITNRYDLAIAVQEYIANNQHDFSSIEISVFDEHYTDLDINAFNVLEFVNCVSPAHGMANGAELMISEIQIDFVNPTNTKIKLGTYKPKYITDRAGSDTDSVDDKEIEDISKKKAEEVLSENAAYVDTMVDSLVTNVLTRGYYHSDSSTFVLTPNIEKDVKGVYHWKKPPGSSTREKTFATTNTQRFREYINISGKNIQFMYEPLVEPSNYSYITEAEVELLTINGKQAYFKSIKNFDLGLTTASPKTIDKTMSSDVEDMYKCRRLKTLRQSGQPMNAIPRLRIYSNSTFNETDNGGQTNVGIVFNEGEVEIEYKTTPNGQTSESDGVRQLSLNMNMMTEQGIELKNGVLLTCDPSHEENGVGLYQGVNGAYFAVRPVKVFENITDLNTDTEVPVGGIGYVKVGGVIS